MTGLSQKGLILSAPAPDLIIIGAGAAGLEIARTASRAGKRVVLFEQGTPSGRHIFQRIPLMVGKVIGNPAFVDARQSVAQAPAAGRQLPVLTGRGLGGSSRVNGNVAYAGDNARYAHVFAPLGLDFSDILKGLETSADHPIPRAHSWSDALSARFTQAAGDAASILHVNTKRGLRYNHYDGYRKTADHSRITVIRAAVDRLLLDGTRVTGVAYQGQTLLGARVVLCAGAIGSPALMLRSGIGAPDMLTQAGVAPTHALPHVGQHLKDHANLRIPFSCPGYDTLNQKTRGLAALWEGIKFVLGRKNTALRGPGASAGINIATDDLNTDAVRIQLVHFTQDRSAVSQKGIVFETAQKASLGIYALWPKSEGSVTLTPKGLAIDQGFLRDPADMATMQAGLAHARRLIGQMGFAPDPQDGEDDSLIRSGVYSGYHLLGSNRMGHTANDSVVDTQFDVHGLGGLSICDASVMPDHLSSHSYLPTIAMARMFATQQGWAV